VADKQYTPMTDQYFATLPVEQLLPELERKVLDYGDYVLRTGKLTQWRTNWEMYCRSELKIGVRFGGDRGQYKLIESNIFRSILTGLVSVICSQRPTFQPEAVNDDHRSMSQDLIFDSVSQYYLKVKKLEDYYKLGTFTGLLFGEGWLYQHWDANVGEIVDVVNDPAQPGKQNPVKEGDAQFDIIYPMDMIRDYTRLDMNNDWYIIRQYVNKWDLIAQRPDLKDDLMGLTITTDLQRFRFGHIIDSQTSNMDLIPVYTFTHKKTAACPEGRFVQYIDSEVYILDTPQPYDEITVYPMCPDVQPMQNFGSTIMTALVKLQYAYDKALSIVLTNQQAFAIQNIVVDDATQTKPEQVIEGLNFIRTNLSKGVPQALQLCKTPEEVFEFLTLMESQMEKLSGLPSILRGTPPTGVESGTAMAFLQAQALVFNSPIQQAYISFLERSATGLFNILKSFANTKRMLAIAGSSKAQYISEFSGKDLENITRVMVSAGNPATRTEAGKIQTAQDLMAKGLIDNAKDYFTVLETGQLDTMIEGPEAQNMYIAEENELLRQGKPCVVSPFDAHAHHIQQHATLFFDTELRMNPQNPILTNVMQHIMNHAQIIIPGLMGPTDPRLLAVLGIQVSMPPALPPPGAQQQPTPHPVANPMPAGHGAPPPAHPGTTQVGNNPTPVKSPVLPSKTPAPTAQAASQMGTAHLPLK
jgi:hypothetical protein